MAVNCRLKFHGVRAFHPTPSRANITSGGNTACIEICDGSSQIFVHAGFGIDQALPNWIIQDKTSRQKHHCAILLSDLFWDSVLGLPFFPPIHFKSSHLEIFSCATNEETEAALNDMSSNLLTPFNGLKSFPAKVTVHHLADTTTWRDWTVSALPLAHPLADYPVAVWRLCHRGGTDLGIIMICNPDHKSMSQVIDFLRGCPTIICAASNGPTPDHWTTARTSFDDAVLIAKGTATQNLILTQFHPEMTDLLLQSELRRLSQLLNVQSKTPTPRSLRLASEIDDYITLDRISRSKAG
jgi:hypothetical protein